MWTAPTILILYVLARLVAGLVRRISATNRRHRSAGPHARGFKQRPDIRAAMPASLTGKFGLQIRQAHIIAPAVRVDFDMVATSIIGAIN
jgi:hypothetical protein